MEARRVFFLAVNTGYALDGEPTPRLASFYAERSSPQLYCAIVGNVVIPGGHLTNSGTAIISSSPTWRGVAAGIKRGSTKPGIQLASVWPGYSASTSFKSKNSSLEIERLRATVNELSAADVVAALNALELGTLLAVDAGFEHVQLHAGHGYLFNLLMDDRLYAGAADVYAAVSQWIYRWKCAGIETSVRFSLQSGDALFDDMGAKQFHDAMAMLPADYLDVSSGFYNVDRRLIYPSRRDVIDVRMGRTLALAQAHPLRDIIASGRIFSTNVDWPKNIHLGVCRDLLANPLFLDERVNGCQNRGRCHYFSRGLRQLNCAQWYEKNERSYAEAATPSATFRK